MLIFVFQCQEVLHLHQIAFQFISLCFSYILMGISTAKAESILGTVKIGFLNSHKIILATNSADGHEFYLCNSWP